MEHYKHIAGIALLAAATAASIGCTKCKTETECCDAKTDACCAPAPAAEAAVAIAMEEGVPGGVVAATLTVQATVAEIDHEARTAALKLSDGTLLSIHVGPEAINFGQVQKGDTVSALVAKELVVAMAPVGTAAGGEAAAAAVLAPAGEMPGGVVAGSVRVIATVVAIDDAARTATLQFEDGTTRTVPVRPDIALSERKVGEKVLFQITEMVALSVEKQ